MMKEIVQTAVWLWNVARNPDVVWVDPETEEEVSRERWKRSARFHTFRPIWMSYFLTTNPGCGCRKRFGLWNTIWCMRHGFEKAGIDLEEWPRPGDDEDGA